MAIFKYKVDSSQVLGTAALEAKLNSAGLDLWDLVVADDSGLLIYMQTDTSVPMKYRVVQVPAIVQASDLEAFLQPHGSQGWEMAALSLNASVVIFKQAA